MQRLAILFSILMLVLTFWTDSAGLAAQPADCVPAFSAAAGDLDGDRDEAPSCPQSGGAHHHPGCTGHQLAVPDTNQLAAAIGTGGQTFVPERFWKPGREPDGQLRPPIA